MDPLIVNYTEFSSISNLKIQPRAEAIKSQVKKRKYKQQELDTFPLVLKDPGDQFTIREVCILDVNLPERPPKAPNVRPCSTRVKRPEVPRGPSNFRPPLQQTVTEDKPRYNWLFLNNQPENHFTPKEVRPRQPVSREAFIVKATHDPKLAEKLLKEKLALVLTEPEKIVKHRVHKPRREGKVFFPIEKPSENALEEIKGKPKERNPPKKHLHCTEYQSEFAIPNTAQTLLQLQRKFSGVN